jgi:hypothetical protein
VPVVYVVMNRPHIDHSKALRRTLAAGKNLDKALGKLRADGASILDCIAAVRAFRGCDLSEAKRLVEFSAAWADVHKRTEESFSALNQEGI